MNDEINERLDRLEKIIDKYIAIQKALTPREELDKVMQRAFELGRDDNCHPDMSFCVGYMTGLISRIKDIIDEVKTN